MRYLLDTNVVSALRVRGRNPEVESWAATVPMSEQFVTALTVAEIERGVTAKERTDPAQGEVLRRWFEHHVLPAFEGRVVSFDLEAARVLGGFRVPEHAPFDDAIVAAIAVARGFTIVTRNLRHFEPLGVPCVDPWRVTEDRPGD